MISNVEITKEDDEINIIQQVFTNIGAKYYINNEDKPNLEAFIEENRFRLTKSMLLEIFTKNKASIYNNYLSLINKSKSEDNMGLLQYIFSECRI